MGWLTDAIRIEAAPDDDGPVVLRMSGAARVALVWPRRSEVGLTADQIVSTAWVDDGWAEAIGPRGVGLQVPKRWLFATTKARIDGARTLALVGGTGPALVIKLAAGATRWSKIVISQQVATSSTASLSALGARS